jgi:DNA-binding NtrC family response regulator
MTVEGRALDILLVDDEEVIHETLGEYLTDMGHHVDSFHDGQQGVEASAKKDYDVAIVDVRMPRMDGLEMLSILRDSKPALSVVVITGHADMELAIQALRLGAADFLPKPVKLLDLDAVLARVARLRELDRERAHLRDVVTGLQRSQDVERRLVGVSPATAAVREQIHQIVAGGADSVLITGETGTGKEVVAREIHTTGAGEERPFIAVSCPSLPETLVESELFGHVRGAFTGALRDRAGAFELANGGTLFLDEVGDLSPAAQAKLLRALETRTVRRVGGAKEIDVEVRVLAATNAGLDADSGFRQDLLFRLNLFTIELPPLRERRDDILPLAEHFLREFGRRRNISLSGFTPASQQALQAYSFPGNARELRNTVERAAILCNGQQIDMTHLSLPTTPAPTAEVEPPSATPEDGERQRIVQALEEARWNRRSAARILDMPYSTLRYKIQRLGIS